jgi:hypothetical protein
MCGQFFTALLPAQPASFEGIILSPHSLIPFHQPLLIVLSAKPLLPSSNYSIMSAI